MRFAKRKLTKTFPMGKLCYDLKLEVLDQTKPNGVLELVKTSAGFRFMLLQKPWIIFGSHVNKISVWDTISIAKFAESLSIDLDSDLYLPLIKRIQSCNQLKIYSHNEDEIQRNGKILNQLKSVKFLDLKVYETGCFLRFLENFHSRIDEEVVLAVNIDFDDLVTACQLIREPFNNFITNQLNDCKKLVLRPDSSDLDNHSLLNFGFPFYHDTYAKTLIEAFQIFRIEEDYLEGVVQSIVQKGVPSKNLKAHFIVWTKVKCLKINSRIVDFLSQFPGMRRFDGESQPRIIETATEHRKNYLAEEDEIHFKDTLFFRRNINSNRDCVYLFESIEINRGDITTASTELLTFYVEP